jgi:uncharacterized membrane protein YczE
MRIALTLGSFVVGVVLMIGFEHPLTRVVGVLALFTFIVSGVFLVASPSFLAQDDDELR